MRRSLSVATFRKLTRSSVNQLFKLFMDDPGFKHWLTEEMFREQFRCRGASVALERRRCVRRELGRRRAR